MDIDLSKNKSFCALPFMHIAVMPDGKMKPCCIAKERIRKEDGSMFSLETDTIEEAFNSEYMNELRTKMLNGEFDDTCSTCYKHEKLGSHSMRLGYTPQFMASIDLNNMKISYLDLRLGNLCNLKCRSCSTLNSSQIAKEFNELLDNGVDMHKYTYIESKEFLQNINNWHQRNSVWDELHDMLPYLTKIYFTGGEPTLIDKNYIFMQEAIDKGFAKNIEVQFNINMTNVTERFVSLISQFKSCYIACSVDGIGKVQEYLRSPSNWKKVEENMMKLKDIPNATLRISPTMQIGNIFSFVEMIKYYESNDLRMLPIILHGPHYLKMELLPTEVKEKIISNMEEFKTQSHQYQNFEDFRLVYDQIIEKLKYDDPERDRRIEDLKSFYSILDDKRNESLEESIPELHEVLYG